jgi:hypothetical protein
VKQKRKYKPAQQKTYSFFLEMMADPSKPMPIEKRTHQLSKMWQGLASIEAGEKPTPADWRICSDAVNLLETLVMHNNGHWLDCDGGLVQITDKSGLLMDAITALAMAGKRHFTQGTIRLDGPGIFAIRSVLEDYAELLEALPERTIIKAHRLTEDRISAILAGRKMPHDVEVVLL